ncbi:MAG TPA: hypothetical protein VFF27_00120 [Bacteroidia bacterium]|jgi:hypothetical protein|nr:hypothetical protein [Bacteroidia bacterium]
MEKDKEERGEAIALYMGIEKCTDEIMKLIEDNYVIKDQINLMAGIFEMKSIPSYTGNNEGKLKADSKI